MNKMIVRDDPIAYVGGYHLDVYCKWDVPHYGDESWTQTVHAATVRLALIQVRRWGWVIHKDGTGTCPDCKKRLKEEKK